MLASLDIGTRDLSSLCKNIVQSHCVGECDLQMCCLDESLISRAAGQIEVNDHRSQVVYLKFILNCHLSHVHVRRQRHSTPI